MAKDIKDPFQLRSQLSKNFMPAKDSTSILLANCLFHIARNPEIWTQLRKDSLPLGDQPLTFELLKSLHSLRYLLHETLRIQGPAGKSGLHEATRKVLTHSRKVVNSAKLTETQFFPCEEVLTAKHQCSLGREKWLIWVHLHLSTVGIYRATILRNSSLRDGSTRRWHGSSPHYLAAHESALPNSRFSHNLCTCWSGWQGSFQKLKINIRLLSI